MANKGKFIDRNPNLRSAGTSIVPDANVGDTLKEFTEEEIAASTIQTKCRKEIQELRERETCMRVAPFLPEEHVQHLLSPELKKTRFIAFREKFSEDMFFKKSELGKVFPLASKPDTFTNENFTYGHPTPVSEKVYELVLPKRTTEEINREYLKWHDKYVKSHNHYFPSERIKRPYNDAFKPNSTFGKKTLADTSGKMMKQCLQQCDRLVVVSKHQKEFKDRTTGHLGSSINRSISVSQEDTPISGSRFKADECDVRALIENIRPCLRENSLTDSIAHINWLRRILFNRLDFHMFDLKFALQQHDSDFAGYIKFNDIFKVLRSLSIRVNAEKLRLAASHYKIIANEGLPNERVNLDLFWKMLHIQHPLPRMGNIANVPENFLNKDTTYKIFCQDRTDHKEARHWPAQMHIPPNADHTGAGDVISPDIPMHYGLTPRDFNMLRPKEELRRIFKRVLNDNFEQIWERAREKVKGDDNCAISVNQLREIMTNS